MKVCEIFTSIQGESTRAGLPCTFIRLSGCNLRCRYCDTRYADDGTDIPAEEILQRVKDAGVSLVEITGGEPLLQGGDTLSLISLLLDSGFELLIETNGSQDIGGIDWRARVILDIKTPGSGMDKEMRFSNIESLKSSDEVKFVVCDEKDYAWSRDIVEKYQLRERCEVLFSPAFGMLEPRLLAGWIIRDRLRVRMNLQLQKYIWGPEERGV